MNTLPQPSPNRPLTATRRIRPAMLAALVGLASLILGGCQSGSSNQASNTPGTPPPAQPPSGGSTPVPSATPNDANATARVQTEISSPQFQGSVQIHTGGLSASSTQYSLSNGQINAGQ